MPEPATPPEPDNEFAKDLAEAFAADEENENPTLPDPKAPADDAKKPEDPKKPEEEPKKDEPAKPEDPKKPEAATPAPAADEKKPEEGAEPKKDPAAPAKPEEAEAPKPLTKEDAVSIFRDIRIEERTSGQAVETATKDVLDAYYPEGLSNVLVDQKSGKELKTPQDVVDASGGDMPIEEATQWLMNEQYKLDKSVAKIKDDARAVAETTVNFKRDSITALQKYEPLFKAYPKLQEKTFNRLMKLVKADDKKGVILTAPDVLEFYDDALEPYQLAYEHATKQSATNNTPEPKKDEPAKPGAEDRLEEAGDGGVTPPDDPNDFAQQVSKELAKGM